MCEIALEPPFAESNTEKTQMEMNLFTWSTLQVGNVDKKFKETGLKTFAVSFFWHENVFKIVQVQVPTK